MHQCLESINSIYIEKQDYKGYNVKPCCLYNNRGNKYRVENIKDIIDNPYIKEIQDNFTKDWRRPECNACVVKENINLKSRRLKSLETGYKGIVNWDIRPGNTCNLKCAMCNFSNSSKWIEDIDVLKKYRNLDINASTRENLDWKWIYENCIDKAEKIYIAGGEPFYMKNVHKFLKNLSRSDWNTKNTEIMIQTNGISNTPKFLEILSKFKKLSFSISIDGWGSVNELIRFPTKHDEVLKGASELYNLDCKSVVFNITVQAMNLPNIDTLVNELHNYGRCAYDIHKLVKPTYLAVNCLKPKVVKNVLKHTKVKELRAFYRGYKFDEAQNKIMQNYLLDLDRKRGTDSKKIIPWCFV